MIVLVLAAGLFSLGLGAWHVGVLRWFDIPGAIGVDEPGRPPVRPFGAGRFVHRTTRADVLGIVRVMNAGTSYVLVSIGVVGLLGPVWLGTPWGRILGLWIAGWWAIRAAMQLRIGRRRIDIVLVFLFAALAAVFVAAAVA
jgi:hypothetical protein